MNKKNLAISISLFITSLFFTFVFYFAKKNLDDNYNSFREMSFSDATIDEPISNEDAKKIEGIDNIKIVGRASSKNNSALYDGENLVINYGDNGFYNMVRDGILLEGDFPKKENQIVIQEGLAKKKKLKIGDRIKVDLGDRIVDGKVIPPVSSFSKNETFRKNGKEEYIISGLCKNIYNENMKINYSLRSLDKKSETLGFLLFDNFQKAYDNKEDLEKEVSKAIGKKYTKITFDKTAISYFRADQSLGKKLMAKAINIFAVVGTVLIFIFFVKNIFAVWALRKIKELSMYKSIGSTDFQIYKLLINEGVKISLLPILIGHILGFILINGVYLIVQDINEVSKEYISFEPILSLFSLLFIFLIVFLALISPAKRISKINIIDGIKGNFIEKDIKLKRNDNIFKELSINNLKSILSQRYISAIGMIIVSVFLIVLSISKYYRTMSYYDYKANIEATIKSTDEKVPDIFYKIPEYVENQNYSISSEKYISIKYNDNFSNDFKKLGLDKKIKEYYDQDEDIYLDGEIIGLDDKTFKQIGGKKGQVLALNTVQDDPADPISKAKYIKYFENLNKIDYSVDSGNTYDFSLNIDKEIYDLNGYRQKIIPFEINLFVDYDTYFKLLDKWNKFYMEDSESKYRNNYILRMKVSQDKIKTASTFIKQELDNYISFNESYNLLTEDDLKEEQATDIKSFTFITFSIGLIIFILNITNGFAAINLSLLSRKREIGSLLSCGIEKNDLKNKFTKDFVLEQVKSISLVIGISIFIVFLISLLSSTLNFKTLASYYDYLYFLIFALLVYGLNIVIYRKSLDNILACPTIDLIKND